MNHLISSFNAGELSPRLESRSDIEKYASGCRVLENFILMPYGGVNRRPGTAFMGAAKFADKKVRLAGFNFSTTTNFILEFGHLYVRFWAHGQQVLSEGLPLEVVTPYTEAQLFEFQFTQINDAVFIVHQSHPVHALKRLADDYWTMEEVDWDWPPMLDQNLTDTTITPGATTGEISLTASAPIFKPEHVGGYFMLAQERSASTITLPLTVSGVSSSIGVNANGSWQFMTHGVWDGTVSIERSQDNEATWTTIRSFVAHQDRNAVASGTEVSACKIRVRCVYVSHAETPEPYAYFESYDNLAYGVAKITEFDSGALVYATVIQPFDSINPTKMWHEGAWSVASGFPRTVCLHEQRLCFAGTSRKPQTVWASSTGDFFNHQLGVAVDSAFAFTLASAEDNAIVWMVSQQALCIGTVGDEYVLGNAGDGSALSAVSLQVKRQSHFGSMYAPALVANETTLFIQRQGRKLREFSYDFQRDGYVAADLTLLADHVTKGGIVQTAFQQQPDAVLWCVTGAGSLAAMTYERAQNVTGWHRHTTAGSFESVAVIYSDQQPDEVWVAVKRTVNGSEVRCIERFDINFREALEDEDKLAWWYLDCAKRVTSPEKATEFAGLDHLEGETVSILADGSVHPSQVVTEGKVTLQNAARSVLVGLPYESKLTPMPIDPGALRDGTAQGRHFRVNRLVLRFYKSLGGEVEVAPGSWDPIYFRDTADAMDSSPPAFTGDKEVFVSRYFEKKANVSVRQVQPLPMTLLGLIPKYEVSEN